jgi:hypothetical protein
MNTANDSNRRFLRRVGAAVLAGILTAPGALSAREVTGAAFLKTGIGARALGLGIFWNPAGMFGVQDKTLSVSHFRYLSDNDMSSLAYAHPTRRGVWGVGVIYLSQGILEGRADDRTGTGSFHASDAMGAVSYSRRLNAELDAGLNLKHVRQRIGSAKAAGAALDAGLIYRTPVPRLDAGLSLQNLGTSMKFYEEPYKMPLSAAAGLSYVPISVLRVNLDVKRLIHDGLMRESLGMEFRALPNLTLRTGYATPMVTGASYGRIVDPSFRSSGGIAGFSAGLGFSFRAVRLDYSFTPDDDLGGSQRVSLDTRF